jgi:hypothetical protein
VREYFGAFLWSSREKRQLADEIAHLLCASREIRPVGRTMTALPQQAKSHKVFGHKGPRGMWWQNLLLPMSLLLIISTGTWCEEQDPTFNGLAKELQCSSHGSGIVNDLTYACDANSCAPIYSPETKFFWLNLEERWIGVSKDGTRIPITITYASPSRINASLMVQYSYSIQETKINATLIFVPQAQTHNAYVDPRNQGFVILHSTNAQVSPTQVGGMTANRVIAGATCTRQQP